MLDLFGRKTSFLKEEGVPQDPGLKKHTGKYLIKFFKFFASIPIFWSQKPPENVWFSDDSRGDEMETLKRIRLNFPTSFSKSKKPKQRLFVWVSLREKCPYSELFWSVFSRIWTEYGEMRENVDQNNSEYGHFLCSVLQSCKTVKNSFSTKITKYINKRKSKILTHIIVCTVNSIKCLYQVWST